MQTKTTLPVTAECLQATGTGLKSDGSQKVWISRLGEKRALLCEAELNERLACRRRRLGLPWMCLASEPIFIDYQKEDVDDCQIRF